MTSTPWICIDLMGDVDELRGVAAGEYQSAAGKADEGSFDRGDYLRSVSGPWIPCIRKYWHLYSL